MMYSSGSRNPCSHICSGELKLTVDRSIFITFGGMPRLCWRNRKIPGNPVESDWPMIYLILDYACFSAYWLGIV